jgi:hypothetical protein
MNLKRTAIIFVGGAALAAWLSAAIAPARPPIASQRIAPAPIDASGAALASEIARLRERLRPSPAPRETLRNPFVFRSSRGSVPSLASTPPAAVGMGASPALAADAGPRLTLAGIAEDAGPDGTPTRIAILSGNGQLFLVKQGEVVNDRNTAYRVGAISTNAVELTALDDGTTRRLSLK